MSLVEQMPSPTSPASLAGPFAPAAEYLIDAAQRSVLFWDVLRQRGNQNREAHGGERACMCSTTSRS